MMIVGYRPSSAQGCWFLQERIPLSPVDTLRDFGLEFEPYANSGTYWAKTPEQALKLYRQWFGLERKHIKLVPIQQ